MDNAGKSTVLDRWIRSCQEKGEEKNSKICPTFGFEIKTILTTAPDTKSPIRLNFWDIGGQKSIRPFWRNYYEETDAIVWVIDSTDSDRLELCKDELQSVLNADVRISKNHKVCFTFSLFTVVEIVRSVLVDFG